jgi:hypothetical protein
MRASLIPRSQLLRAARWAALVRRRTGILSPRFPVSRAVRVGNTSVPVGTANSGKNKLPPGFVV